MTKIPDEEDEEETAVDVAAISRRAWYAGNRAGAESGLESAAFRGVPGVPHGGSQSVKPEDTRGSYEFCWCGLPFDHDWPGKVLGADHPQKDITMSTPDSSAPPRIERKQLRGYHADLVDVILTAVNQYGVKYRLTDSRILLFPPDGTAPLAISGGSSNRQRRKLQAWFVRHCVDPSQPIKRSESVHREVTPEVVKELAETVDSEEHLSKLQEPAKTAKAAPAAPPAPKPAPPAKKAAATPQQPVGDKPQPQVIDPNGEPGEWVPYMYPKGKIPQEPHPYFITNGVQVKCKTHDLIIEAGPAGTGGHSRTYHTDTTSLWGPEAKAKMSETARLNNLRKKVEAGIEMLQQAIGVVPGNPEAEAELAKQVKENTRLHARIAELEKASQEDNPKVAELEAEVGRLQARISDLETKQALAKEALEALGL